MSECPGHFGHIELARPIFHPGFMKTVKKILECVCTNCGKLKVDDRDRNLFSTLNRLQPKYRLKYVHEAAKGVMVCEEDEGPDEQGNLPPPGHGGCGHRQPLVRREGTKMFAVYKKIEEDADAKRKVSTICPCSYRGNGCNTPHS
jgi:DNA-directed RNA polymerase II subunit RPB1